MPETKTKIETDTDQLTIETDTDQTKIETDTDKIETCNMHTLVAKTRTPGGLGMSRGDGECYGTRTLKES